LYLPSPEPCLATKSCVPVFQSDGLILMSGTSAL
jgi:hypothetical protein